jgi:ATP-binding cassette subfamily B protein
MITAIDHLKTIKRGLAVLFQIEKHYFIYLVLSSMISPVIPYINIYFMANIVNNLSTEQNLNKIAFFVIAALCLNLILSLLSAWVNHLKGYHHNQFFKNEKMLFSEKIMNMDYESVENKDVYYLHEKIKAQSQTGYNMFYLYNFFGEVVDGTINISISLVFILPILFNREAALFMKIIMLVSMLVITIINFYCNKKANALNIGMYEKFIPYNAVFNFYADYFDNYNAGKDIRLYSMEKMLEEEQLSQNTLSNNILITTRKKMLKFVLSSNLLKDIFLICVYLFVIQMVLNKNIMLGDMAKYAACITLFINAFAKIIADMETLFENNKCLKDYLAFLDIPSKNSQQTKLLNDFSGFHEFRLQNVSFKYPASDSYALKNISLAIKAGKKTAIVGENGSGKSTLIKLLCCLYDVEDGTICLDGVNINEYDQSSYWKILSAVFQDFVLFSFPLGQNVAASREYDIDRSMNALEKAGFSPRFENMENGLETILYKDFDDDGIELSGGEAQKIAAARAFYRGSPILLLDEPTAALDPLAEKEIYDRVNHAAPNTTTVFVSHRLSSCKFCDEIIVLHKGQLVQQGTHNELLLDQSGKYYELWNAQAQFYQT